MLRWFRASVPSAGTIPLHRSLDTGSSSVQAAQRLCGCLVYRIRRTDMVSDQSVSSRSSSSITITMIGIPVSGSVSCSILAIEPPRDLEAAHDHDTQRPADHSTGNEDQHLFSHLLSSLLPCRRTIHQLVFRDADTHATAVHRCP